MQFEPRTYGQPARRPAIGHNVALAISIFFLFIGAIVWPTAGVAGGYIIGVSAVVGGLAALLHPRVWRR